MAPAAASKRKSEALQDQFMPDVWRRPGECVTEPARQRIHVVVRSTRSGMAAHMPVRAIARLVGEHDTRLWRIIHHYVDRARGQRDDSGVRNVGIDDKSVRRGHDYVTVFADLHERKVLFVADERKGAIEQFRWDLIEQGGDPDQVAEICVDMSAAYIAGVENSFPRASITFDRFTS